MSENANDPKLAQSEEEVLDQFLDKIKTEYKDTWTESNWEEEMEKHPFFMTKIPDDPNDLPPAVEALRQLKWDAEDGPKEKALKLKDEGNLYFKVKNYKNAVVSYTLALKENFDDKELMSILHSNRAAAHYQIQNFRSALNDCIFARKFNPKNLKPIYKGAECCYELKNFNDCIKWCDMGLEIDSNDKKLRDLRTKAESDRKAHEKEQRKKETVERRKIEQKSKLWELIKEKGIRVHEKEKQFANLLENPVNPQQQKVVHLNEDGNGLIWPVVFLYPEFGQTDFIESFDENTTFEDHLKVMFNEPPEWDVKNEYKLASLRIYYENRDKNTLGIVNKKLTLLEALKLDGMVVQVGTPNFVIMVKNSAFEKLYLQKLKEITG